MTIKAKHRRISRPGRVYRKFIHNINIFLIYSVKIFQCEYNEANTKILAVKGLMNNINKAEAETSEAKPQFNRISKTTG